jgi:hypothetical protein
MASDLAEAGGNVDALMTAVQKDTSEEAAVLKRDVNGLQGTLSSDAQGVLRAIDALATSSPEGIVQAVSEVTTASQTFITAHCASP